VGSGGGISAFESKPSYQVFVNASARAVPDISYDADPGTGFYTYDTLVGSGASIGFNQTGGTSAGAPQWAALVALADQARGLNGLGTLSSSQTLRAIDQTLPITDFQPIVPYFSAYSYYYGYYGLQTGWGTPHAARIINDLASGFYG
jgi:subtilase family serine protease